MTAPLILRSLGSFSSMKALDAHVLEADGVHHAGWSFDDAGGGVAGHGLAGETLGDEAADAVEGDDVVELYSVAEGSAGGDDGRGEFDPGDGDAHVGAFGWAWGGRAGLAHLAGALAGVCEVAALVSGRIAMVRTWPTEAEGWLMRRSEAKVAAMSTGATRSW